MARTKQTNATIRAELEKLHQEEQKRIQVAKQKTAEKKKKLQEILKKQEAAEIIAAGTEFKALYLQNPDFIDIEKMKLIGKKYFAQTL